MWEEQRSRNLKPYSVVFKRKVSKESTRNVIDEQRLAHRVLVLGTRVALIVASLCPANICLGDNLIRLNIVEILVRKALELTKTISPVDCMRNEYR